MSRGGGATVDSGGAPGGDGTSHLYAFDLDGHGQDVWDRVEPLVEADVLRAYLAHVTLVCTDWAIRLRPDDVPRQLARAERVLDRYV